MTSEQETRCHAIIHSVSALTAGIGAGLAQLPGSDSIPISALQTGMIVSVGAVFDVAISRSSAQSLLAASITSTAGRTISEFFIGWIPGVGNAVNAITAASLTETIGWIMANQFDKQKKHSFDCQEELK